MTKPLRSLLLSAPLCALLAAGCAAHAAAVDFPAAASGFAQLEIEAGGVKYTGVSAPEVLQAHFGKPWFSMQAVRFVCADGYKRDIAVADLIASQPLLVTARADGAPFRGVKHEKEVELGPAMLVWPEGVDRPGSDSPYQIVRVEAATGPSVNAPPHEAEKGTP